MIVIEIPPNGNCAATDMRVFHDVEPARAITRIRLEREQGQPAWCDVTGWTVGDQPCPALAQKVDDSGEGTAFLIYGGDAGIRLRPAGSPEAWTLDSPQQWGESFIIAIDVNDLKFIDVR